MKIKTIQDVKTIPKTKICKVVNMGHIVEVMCMDKLNRDGLPITKLNKHEYVINATGEVQEYQHTENRTQNKDNLRKTFKKIRHLINYNFQGNKNELAFTITYAENMTDVKRLYSDFKKFFLRLRYKYPNVDYLNVVEPQERGAWHCHVLLKFNDVSNIYIPNKEIAELWGQGFVTVKAIRQDVDNMGAYLSAYLGDIELNDDNMHEYASKNVEVKEVELQGKKKRFVKGGRLHLYPTGMNIYRKSKGILIPEESWVEYQEVKKIVGNGTPHYSKTIDIVDDNNISINSITYEQYNLKR